MDFIGNFASKTGYKLLTIAVWVQNSHHIFCFKLESAVYHGILYSTVGWETFNTINFKKLEMTGVTAILKKI